VKRALGLALTVLTLLAGFVYVHYGQPGWWFRLWHPLSYEQIVLGHAKHYDLDPALLAAVIYQESRFRPNARSSSGAIGLMQLMPKTAQGIADHTGGTRFKLSDLYDPEINVRYGAWYLHHLMQKYGSEKLALAAYNAGQENVDRWLAEGAGIAFAETREYVARVEKLQRLYRNAYPVLRAGTSSS
jgi:soluble lytic murein transglycosylase